MVGLGRARVGSDWFVFLRVIFGLDRVFLCVINFSARTGQVRLDFFQMDWVGFIGSGDS